MLVHCSGTQVANYFRIRTMKPTLKSTYWKFVLAKDLVWSKLFISSLEAVVSIPYRTTLPSFCSTMLNIEILMQLLELEQIACIASKSRLYKTHDWQQWSSCLFGRATSTNGLTGGLSHDNETGHYLLDHTCRILLLKGSCNLCSLS